MVVRGELSILELGGGAVVVGGGAVVVGGGSVVVGGGSIVVGGGSVVVVGGGAGPCCILVGGDVEEIGLLGTWGDVVHPSFISFPVSDGICSVLLLGASSKTFYHRQVI